ncbi:MAG: monooxygenase [Alphaproteobacteria bacterium]|nr:monooxygenase [Alphaproteobacteria bacterium]
MRIGILGAGPAGLYLAYLLKRRRPGWEVQVVEQNRLGSTFGFGVVFSERALEFLSGSDPETAAAIAPHLESWNDIAINHRGERIFIDGIGFAAIGRLTLLRLLAERARSAGAVLDFERHVERLDELEPADLVVGADGIRSLVRQAHAAFGTQVTLLRNRFAWFGTTKRFDTLSQSFVATEHGVFNAHHYRYAPDRSTFIVEVDEETFFASGFDRLPEDEARLVCERAFAETLDGHPLIANNSAWRQFPVIRNQRWSVGKCVLLGDALHTAHFSIGSGTRLAMEDAIALDCALAGHEGDLPSALAAYETARRPILEKLVGAANASGAWYERFREHMRLPPLDFAMSYVTRSGRVDRERLRRVSPGFVARYERGC